MILDTEFNDLHEKLKLTQTQQGRIESAVNSITSYLQNYFSISEQLTFVQGSVATGTVTKPQDSSIEYDVDIVAVVGDENSTPANLLQEMQECFEASGNYSDKIVEDDERPCIRLQYAEESSAKFHIDIVPARVGMDAPLEIPTRKREWRNTAPREFVQWSLDHTDNYRKIVMLLKRWRDVNGVDVSSIILQVIVAEAMEGNNYSSFTRTLTQCIDSLSKRFPAQSNKPSIYNPVLDSEDLAKRWDEEEYTKFTAQLEEAAENSLAAYEETDKEAAVALWQKIFGTGFTTTIENNNSLVLSHQQIALTLGDTSHAQVAKWQESAQLFNANISATATWSAEKKVYKPRAKVNHWQTIKLSAHIKIKSGQNLNKGLLLNYFLNTNAPKPYTIYWQVVNTGESAAQDLRGQITERTGHRIQEHTRYTGTHWVEAYIIQNDVCIARTDKFFININ